MKLLRKMWLMMISEVTKNQVFTLSLEDTFLENPHGELRVKVFITTFYFFAFRNIFFYTQLAFVFHLLRDFYILHDHILAFVFFIFSKISFTRLSLNFSPCFFFIISSFLYIWKKICEKKFGKKFIKNWC